MGGWQMVPRFERRIRKAAPQFAMIRRAAITRDSNVVDDTYANHEIIMEKPTRIIQLT